MLHRSTIALGRPSFSTDGPSCSGRSATCSRSVLTRAGPGGKPGMSPESLKVNFDPEKLLGAPKSGHIARRMQEKVMQKDAQAYAVVIKKDQEERISELTARRGSRAPPAKDYQLVEYLLDTNAEDMEFEIARCRPLLTPEFFKYLKTQASSEKFSIKPDADRVAELETLYTYLEQGVQAVDAAVATASSAVERMKKLLSSPDKKQCILDMAAANEIDLGLVELLLENAKAAREAQNEQAAIFMEKVAMATSKYLVSPA